MLKIINKGAKSDLPFSPAIQVGDLVYISGQASARRESLRQELAQFIPSYFLRDKGCQRSNEWMETLYHGKSKGVPQEKERSKGEEKTI